MAQIYAGQIQTQFTQPIYHRYKAKLEFFFFSFLESGAGGWFLFFPMQRRYIDLERVQSTRDNNIKVIPNQKEKFGNHIKRPLL